MKVRWLGFLGVIALAVPGAGTAQIIPDAVPDLPVLTSQARVGNDLITRPLAPVTPTPKVVDGSIDDWTGDISRLGGTAIYSAGEYVYQDYINDDFGADDGNDAARVAVTDTAIADEPRTYRAEVLAQALGEQFGADDVLPTSIAAPAEYGDAAPPAHLRDHSDIAEVRVAADDDDVTLLVRTTGMVTAGATAVLILIDDLEGGMYDAPGVTSTAAEHALIVAGDAVTQRWHRGVQVCGPCPSLDAATDASGYTNAVEVAIPRASFDDAGALRIAVGAGVVDPDDGGLLAVQRGDAASPLMNVAFRFDEPARIWMDHDQALALHAGSIDDFFAAVDLDRLQAGYTEAFEPRPGYYERVYISDSPVNRESVGDKFTQGAHQHYGIYFPTGYSSRGRFPTTWWTHYRGGHAHDAAAWLPGLIRQLGEDQGNIVITPSARSTSSWYVGIGHEDFLEVWDDSMASFPIDENRVYLSGYSMGGYASYLLGLLYPDRWAGSFPTAGPPTQGLWDGVGAYATGTNDGRPYEQLTFDLIRNAANLPYVIYHGTNDELVPVSGAIRVASELTRLGFTNRLYLFPGAEHYTNAIYDEWGDAAGYLNGFRRDPTPARVAYTVKPSLEKAVEEVRTPVVLDYTFDGAYWVDGLTVRSGDPTAASTLGTIDALTLGRGAETSVGIPESGRGTQVMPYTMVGLTRVRTGWIEPANAFEATLDNLATATLDLAGMGLSPSSTIAATITADGPTRITLAGSWATAPVVNGATLLGHSTAGVTIGVEAGTHSVTIG